MQRAPLKRCRLAAILILCLSLPLVMCWLWWHTVYLPVQAARYGLAVWFTTQPWQTEFRNLAYLFPQTVAAGTLVDTFTQTFPSDHPSPLIVESKQISVIDYFYVTKRGLDRHHFEFGTYPEPEQVSSRLNLDFWPSLEQARCRYLRLSQDAFLLGWAGSDGIFEDHQLGLKRLTKPYGLVRIGDDWWVRCVYFGLIQNVQQEEEILHKLWPVIERVLKVKGIDLYKAMEQFYVSSSPTFPAKIDTEKENRRRPEW